MLPFAPRSSPSLNKQISRRLGGCVGKTASSQNSHFSGLGLCIKFASEGTGWHLLDSSLTCLLVASPGKCWFIQPAGQWWKSLAPLELCKQLTCSDRRQPTFPQIPKGTGLQSGGARKETSLSKKERCNCQLHTSF